MSDEADLAREYLEAPGPLDEEADYDPEATFSDEELGFDELDEDYYYDDEDDLYYDDDEPNVEDVVREQVQEALVEVLDPYAQGYEALEERRAERDARQEAEAWVSETADWEDARELVLEEGRRIGFSNVDADQVLELADDHLSTFHALARADGWSEEQIQAETPTVARALVHATMESMKNRAIMDRAMGGRPSEETLEDLRKSGWGQNWRR